ncbi:MAG TPA: hypothetical protein VF756_17290 [Thermoanaerobaculia bacterium]
MAQAAAWVDFDHFAVGRWDGSLTLFRFSEARTLGPLIAVAASSPSSEGVQMITWLAPGVFATSNDDESIAVWSPTAAWDRLRNVATLTYDSRYGAANSGDAFELGSGLCFVVGHANGYVTIWRGNASGSEMALAAAVDVRSAKPVNPWDLHNVRGVAAVEWNGGVGHVVTGSEDGDLCIVRVPDGEIVSRSVYNPAAQRGVNALAVRGTDLLVANCSVGSTDRNLWFYTIDTGNWSISCRDSINLRVNPAAPQVFNFTVVWGEYERGHPCFFSSTQEGALWMGTITGDRKLSVIGYQQVTAPLGSALAFASNGNLALIAYDLYEFKTLLDSAAGAAANANPQRPRV